MDNKFNELAKKYNFKSVDEMLNSIYNEIEYILEVGLKHKQEVSED